jgi:hypothetical protein
MFDFMRTVYENTRHDAARELALQSRLTSEAVAKTQPTELERQLQEMQMSEARRRIEEEVAEKYKAVLEATKTKVDVVDKTLGGIRDEHATKMKAKDEEALLIETARKKLELELDAMRQSKVGVYFIPWVHVF